MKTTAFLLTMLVPAVATALQTPTTGYAPVNGLKMYYEVRGSGEPVVLLHEAFASRLAILPNTTHVTLMQRISVIVPMVDDFREAAKAMKQDLLSCK